MATDSPATDDDPSTAEEDSSTTNDDPTASGDAEPSESTPVAALDGLAIPDDADDAEAAAIAAAIAAHLRDRRAAAAAAAAADADGESRRSWAFAGRLAGIGESAGRPPTTTPTDAWTAASRADRF